MSAEAVMHAVGVLTCATTLSLFTTIVAFAAVNVAPLRWDGSMCAASPCSRAITVIDGKTKAVVHVAHADARSF